MTYHIGSLREDNTQDSKGWKCISSSKPDPTSLTNADTAAVQGTTAQGGVSLDPPNIASTAGRPTGGVKKQDKQHRISLCAERNICVTIEA